MILTIELSVIMMAGLFLMLLAGVAFIQDKRYFTSAPKDVQEAILPRGERFPGAYAIGWILMALSLFLIVGALIFGGWQGIREDFGFLGFYERFLLMIILVKIFDILFFDWFLLCHSNFYPHFYPETKGIVGPHQFGFNKKSHVMQIAAGFVVAAVLSGICIVLK
ncbi:MAG: hypothetical protein K6E13_08075 [Lachnospiraceae bacterium]|nr:hypothetical protein [Lachnospiraceae bacterium]